MIYLKRESVASNLNGNGMPDFAGSGYYDVNGDNALYVTYTSHDGYLAHDSNNLENFLWGAAAASLKVPGVIARIGAHVNNFFSTVKIGFILIQKMISYHSFHYMEH